jgi:ABC-type antimicrobial peptide transport system permease subunit
VPRSDSFIIGLPPRASEARIDENFLDSVQNRRGVKSIIPYVRLNKPAQVMIGKYVAGASVFGMRSDDVYLCQWNFKSGVLSLQKGEAIVGSKVGDNLYDHLQSDGKPVSPMNLQDETLVLSIQEINQDEPISSYRKHFRIVSVLDETGGEEDFSVYLNLEDMQRIAPSLLMKGTAKSYSHARVVVSDRNMIPTLSTELISSGYLAYSPDIILRQIRTVLSAIELMLLGITGIMFVVSGIGIANVLFMSVYERIHEIGLMKAVGATNSQILLIFICEAICVALLGGLGGTVFGVLFSIAINSTVWSLVDLTDNMAFSNIFTTPISIFMIVPLFAIFVGVAAGFVPAQKAANLDPLSALKHD